MSNQQQTALFLVRHGETDLYYSEVESVDDRRRLNQRGRGQAKKVGEYLKDFGCAAVYSSPRHRCKETALIIKKEADILGEVVIDKRLDEFYPGDTNSGTLQRLHDYFLEVSDKYAGQQVVAVTHQHNLVSIAAEVTKKFDWHEASSAAVLRLVFAGRKLVQASWLHPSG